MVVDNNNNRQQIFGYVIDHNICCLSNYKCILNVDDTIKCWNFPLYKAPARELEQTCEFTSRKTWQIFLLQQFYWANRMQIRWNCFQWVSNWQSKLSGGLMCKFIYSKSLDDTRKVYGNNCCKKKHWFRSIECMRINVRMQQWFCTSE